MKKVLLLVTLAILYSCAPLPCPGERELRSVYSEDSAPKSYKALVFVRYGILRTPVYLEKEGGRYTIRSAQTGTALLEGRNLCIGVTCIDLPISPDVLLFGAVLSGDEKPSCSLGSVVFERDDQAYLRKYYFSNGELKKVELLDKKKDKLLLFEYGQKSKEGYYKNIKVSLGDISFVISVEELSR